jgi:hypothetical protein
MFERDEEVQILLLLFILSKTPLYSSSVCIGVHPRFHQVAKVA